MTVLCPLCRPELTCEPQNKAAKSHGDHEEYRPKGGLHRTVAENSILEEQELM